MSLSQPTIVQSKSRWDFIQFIIKYSLFCSVAKHLLFFQEGSFHTFQLIVPIREGFFSVMGFYYIGRNYYVNCIPLIMKIEATLKSLCDRMSETDELLVLNGHQFICILILLFECLFVVFSVVVWKAKKLIFHRLMNSCKREDFIVWTFFNVFGLSGLIVIGVGLHIRFS